MGRAETQQRREKIVLEIFTPWYAKRRRVNFQIQARPDPKLPPDGLIASKRRFEWVEITDVYMSREWYEYSYSIGTVGETERPLPQGRGPAGSFVNADKQIAAEFCANISKKLLKTSYGKLVDQHGPGILLVSMFYIWWDRSTAHEIARAWNEHALSMPSTYFKEIYVVVNPLHWDRVVSLESILGRLKDRA